jgi:hypothetical protein
VSHALADPYSIAPYQPVNFSHPLNQGLVAWYLTNPLTRGGKKWYDLTSRYHGTLPSGTSDFHTTERPGGWGDAELTGSSNRITTSLRAFGRLSMTTATWFRADSLSGDAGVGIGEWNTSAGQRTWLLRIRDSGVMQFFTFAGTTQIGGNIGYTYTAGTWVHIIAVYDGAQMRAYVNGELTATQYSQSGTLGEGAANLSIGNHGASGANFSGGVDDCRLYARAIKDRDARHIHDSSRRFHPGLLNRQSTATRFFVVSGGTAEGSATLDTEIDLVATGATTPKASADLDTTVNLVAVGKLNAKASSVLDVGINLVAVGKLDPVASATLELDADLTATGKTTPKAEATLSFTVAFTAVGSAPAVGTTGFATLDTEIDLAAVGKTTPKASTDLDTNVTLSAQGKTTPKASAVQGLDVDLFAVGLAPTVVGSAEGFAVLDIDISFTAVAEVQYSGSAVLDTEIDLIGVGNAPGKSGNLAILQLSDGSIFIGQLA